MQLIAQIRSLSFLFHPKHCFLSPPLNFNHAALLITAGIDDFCPVRGQLSDSIEVSQMRPDGVTQTLHAALFDFLAEFEATEVLHCLVVGSACSSDSTKETKAQSD